MQLLAATVHENQSESPIHSTRLLIGSRQRLHEELRTVFRTTVGVTGSIFVMKFSEKQPKVILVPTLPSPPLLFPSPPPPPSLHMHLPRSDQLFFIDYIYLRPLSANANYRQFCEVFCADIWITLLLCWIAIWIYEPRPRLAFDTTVFADTVNQHKIPQMQSLTLFQFQNTLTMQKGVFSGIS